jgi:hypothetical protein
MDYLSLLPAELQWEIYRHCWRGCIRYVHRELLQHVEQSHHCPQKGLLFRRKNRRWERNLMPDHLYDWGLWRKGRCRQYFARNDRLFVGRDLIYYRNLFFGYPMVFRPRILKYKLRPECKYV